MTSGILSVGLNGEVSSVSLQCVCGPMAPLWATRTDDCNVSLSFLQLIFLSRRLL